MEQILGRKLATNEHIHHKDEDTLNNDPDNLEIISPRDHVYHHKPQLKPVRPKTSCGYCGKPVPRNEGKVYCSARCKFYAKYRTFTCKGCGKKFIAPKRMKRLYCSRKCRHV